MKIYSLQIISPREKDRVFQLQAGLTTIGRGKDSSIVLNDINASANHGQFKLTEHDCLYEDLGSTNGTEINNQPSTGAQLQDKDEVVIGATRIIFHINDEVEASAEISSEKTLFANAPTPGEKSTKPRQKHVTKTRKLSTRRDWLDRLAQFLPILGWLPNYNKTLFSADLTAGITIAVMLIPQGLAYAMLAGLPPIMGLYASILPMMIYALTGTSRQTSVGPVALDSILVAIGIGLIAEVGSESFIQMAILLALMIGVIQILMSIFRAGFLVNFLSYPVLTGFTSAAAVIIAVSQLKHITGLDLPSGYRIDSMLIALFQQLTEINVPTLVLGMAGIIVLIQLKRWLPKLPGPITVVVLGILVTGLFGLPDVGVRIVGDIPAGLPSFSWPQITVERLKQLFPLALTLAFVGFSETVSIGKTLADKQGQRIDANQELIGIGLANISASVTQGFPVAGGFARSLVNAKSGAKTQMASIISATLMVVTLLLLTSLVYYLPNAILAAIIMVSVTGLIDVKEIRYLFRIKKSEGILLVFTFLATLSLGIIHGLAAGMIASILLFISLNTKPHTAILGRLPGTNIFRNVEHFPQVEIIEGLVILRIDASFYFANTEFLKTRLRDILTEYEGRIKALILDASAVNDLDSSADSALHQIVDEFQKKGITMYIAGVKEPVRAVMRRSGLYDKLGSEHFFFTLDATVKRYLEKENTKNNGVS